MTSAQLLAATQAARKRKLQGASLAVTLLVLDKPVEIGHLASKVGISSAALTGLVDRLAKLGYVSRETVSGDRRKWNVQITNKGTAAIEAILQEQ